MSCEGQALANLSSKQTTKMECAVCYDECSQACKLVCGHVFCSKCVKEWYHKGTGTGCPMCRRPMYFKGFHKAREAWDEEAWEGRCDEVFGETFDAVLTEAIEMAEYFPRRFRREILSETLTDLREMEKTFRFLKSEGYYADEIDFVLNETANYYSDRHIDQCRYIDEPPKELAPRQPLRAASRRGRRVRARQDPWCTMSFVIEL